MLSWQPLDMQYIAAAANLRAFNYGLKGERDPAIYRKVIETMDIPRFTPKSGIKIQINENEPVSNDNDGVSDLHNSTMKLNMNRRRERRCHCRLTPSTFITSWLPPQPGRLRERRRRQPSYRLYHCRFKSSCGKLRHYPGGQT